MVAQVGGHVDVDAGRPRPVEQEVARAAAQADRLDPLSGIPGHAGAVRGLRQRVGDALGEGTQGHRLGKAPEAARAPVARVEVGQLDHVVRRLLVGVHRPHGRDDRVTASAREHTSMRSSGTVSSVPTVPIARVRTLQRPEPALAERGEGRLVVVADASGARLGQRVSHRGRLRERHEDDELVARVLRVGLQGATSTSPSASAIDSLTPSAGESALVCAANRAHPWVTSRCTARPLGWSPRPRARP